MKWKQETSIQWLSPIPTSNKDTTAVAASHFSLSALFDFQTLPYLLPHLNLPASLTMSHVAYGSCQHVFWLDVAAVSLPTRNAISNSGHWMVGKPTKPHLKN